MRAAPLRPGAGARCRLAQAGPRSPRAGDRASWRPPRAAASPPDTPGWHGDPASCVSPGQVATSSVRGSVRRVRLALADRSEQDAHACGAVLVPRWSLCDERDQIVEVRALDGCRNPVGKSRHPQPPVLVLRCTDREERLERGLAGASLGELLRELGALVVPDVAARDRRPEALLVVVEVFRVDALPFALDHSQPARHVGCDGHEPRCGRELAARAALLAPAWGGRDSGALAVEIGVEQRMQRDDAVGVGRGLGRVDRDTGLLARIVDPR